MHSAISIRNLYKQYKKGARALDGINLEIPSGMFGLLGPNGAGKTTLMRILATLLTPTEGNVRINGHDLLGEPAAIRQMLGYLPQDFNTYQHLTVEQVLDYVALLKGITDKTRRKQQIYTVLEQVHLSEQRYKRVSHLSGGMKQRLGIGQALLNNPQLLIVDEPTAGLDPQERIRFRNLLADLSDQRIVLLSTHIVGDVESSCANLAVLDLGQVRFTGTPGELAAKAQGQVWEMETDDAGRSKLPTNARVVSTRRLAASIQLRVLCPTCPLPGASETLPGLEEGYLAVINEQGGASQ